MWWLLIGGFIVLLALGIWIDSSVVHSSAAGWGWFIGFIGGAGLLAVLITGGVNWVERVGCERASAQLERPHSYGLIEGCFIEDTSGRLIPLENYRVTSEEE